MARVDKKKEERKRNADGSGLEAAGRCYFLRSVCALFPKTAVWSSRASMEDCLSCCPLPNFPRLFWKPPHTWFVRYAGGMWYGRLDFTHLQLYPSILISQQRAVAVTEMVYCGVVDRGEGEVWGKKGKRRPVVITCAHLQTVLLPSTVINGKCYELHQKAIICCNNACVLEILT